MKEPEPVPDIRPPGKLPPLSLDTAWQAPALDAAWKSGNNNYIKALRNIPFYQKCYCFFKICALKHISEYHLIYLTETILISRHNIHV